MSIADKLQELIDSKADMKSAIAEKGVEVEGGLTSYASAIRKIQQGSGEGGSDINWSGVRFGGSRRIPLKSNELYKCGDMDSMFEGCDIYMLKMNQFDFYNLDTSFATKFSRIFRSCDMGGINDFTKWDTSNVKSLYGAFEDASGVSINGLSNWNTSNVTNMAYCFRASREYLYELRTIPNWDYSSVEQIDRFVEGQLLLESIPRINLRSLKPGHYWMLESFNYTHLNDKDNVVGTPTKFERLTDIGGFIDLKISIPNNFINHCPNLTVESLTNIIRDIYDWNTNPENLNISDYTHNTIYDYVVLNFGEVNLNKLTDDQIAAAIAKGWTLI